MHDLYFYLEHENGYRNRKRQKDNSEVKDVNFTVNFQKNGRALEDPNLRQKIPILHLHDKLAHALPLHHPLELNKSQRHNLPPNFHLKTVPNLQLKQKSKGRDPERRDNLMNFNVCNKYTFM